MWIIFILAVCTAAVSNTGWANSIRLSAGPVYINFYLMVLTFAVLAAAVRGRHYLTQFPVQRTHPLFGLLLLLFALAWFAGLFGLLWVDVNMLFDKDTGTHVREFLALPAAIFVGYRLTAVPRSSERFAYVLAAVGVAVSIAVILHFRSSAAIAQTSGSVDRVRTINYLTDYAGIACALLGYSVIASIPVFKPRTALAIAAFCLVGQFAPLHRSSWIACAAGFAGVILILPRQQRIRSAMIGVLMVPVFVLALWGAMFVASAWTGWNFHKKMEERVLSLLPIGERYSYRSQRKAWDTRVGGTFGELKIWASSPLFGRGFGAQQHEMMRTGIFISYYHNAWTDTMAKTGLLGLTPVVLTVGGCFVIGRRMVREQVDRSSVLIGALGVITASYYFVHGMSTGSFNGMRGGICLGLICGVLLRCRDMQLVTRQEMHAAEASGTSMPQHPGEPPAQSAYYGQTDWNSAM